MPFTIPRLRNLLLLAAFSACNLVGSTLFAAEQKGYQITLLTNRARVEINGKLFTEYYFKDVPRPYLYPIIGPGESQMTRNYPMQALDGEEHDHPHHRSVWFAHGDMNGHDFWTENANSGKMVHEKFVKISSSKKSALISSKNRWMAKDGTVVATDERTIRFSGNFEKPVIDFEITIHASNGELKMGDTKEGTMAVRVAESMRVFQGAGKPAGEGHIVLSTGISDDNKSVAATRKAKQEAVTWGKRAAWCDYYGPVNGKIVGVAMFDHPKNPQFPTWWHVRDYGLFAANPYGVHDFEKKPKGTGDFIIPAGKSVTYRYRIVFHEGDEKQAGIAKLFKKYEKE